MRDLRVEVEPLHRNQLNLMEGARGIRGIKAKPEGPRFRIDGPRGQLMIAYRDGRVAYSTETNPHPGYIPMAKARGLLAQWRILGEDDGGICQGLADSLEGLTVLYLAGVPNRRKYLAYRAYVLRPGTDELEHITEALVDAAVFPGHVMALFMWCDEMNVLTHAAENLAKATGWEWKVKIL